MFPHFLSQMSYLQRHPIRCRCRCPIPSILCRRLRLCKEAATFEVFIFECTKVSKSLATADGVLAKQENSTLPRPLLPPPRPPTEPSAGVLPFALPLNALHCMAL